MNPWIFDATQHPPPDPAKRGVSVKVLAVFIPLDEERMVVETAWYLDGLPGEWHSESYADITPLCWQELDLPLDELNRILAEMQREEAEG